MKEFLKFIKLIPGYFKFYHDHEYTGNDIEFIIQNYTKVLCSRTRTMSNPTYCAEDVISEIDRFYQECQDEEKDFSTADDVVELLNIIKKYKPKQEIILIDNSDETYYVKLGKCKIYVGKDDEIVIERD